MRCNHLLAQRVEWKVVYVIYPFAISMRYAHKSYFNVARIYCGSPNCVGPLVGGNGIRDQRSGDICAWRRNDNDTCLRLYRNACINRPGGGAQLAKLPRCRRMLVNLPHIFAPQTEHHTNGACKTCMRLCIQWFACYDLASETLSLLRILLLRVLQAEFPSNLSGKRAWCLGLCLCAHVVITYIYT